MKIIEKYGKEEREVYVIYWSDFQGGFERYHCIIPEDGYPGFLSVPESECDLTDASVTNFIIIKSAAGNDVLMHPILANDNSLYVKLIDHDPEAMKLFLHRLSIMD